MRLMKEKKIKSENKIIPIQFEEKELMDELLDEILREEFQEEADALEEKLNADPELMGVGASDDLFLKIVAELKEKKLWEEETEEADPEKNVDIKSPEPDLAEEDKNKQDISDEEQFYAQMPEQYRRIYEKGLRAEQKEKVQQRRNRKIKKILKRVSAAAAMFVLVIGVSMTSEASRRLVLQVWDTVAVNLGFKVETDYTGRDSFVRSKDKQEVEDAQKISEELGIASMDMTYLPEGMEYLRSEIDTVNGNATMFYLYQEKIFIVNMVKQKTEGVYYYAIDTNADIKKIYTDAQGIESAMGKVNEENGLETYTAQILYKECTYVLNGTLTLDEMEKIVKNSYFL